MGTYLASTKPWFQNLVLPERKSEKWSHNSSLHGSLVFPPSLLLSLAFFSVVLRFEHFQVFCRQFLSDFTVNFPKSKNGNYFGSDSLGKPKKKKDTQW
jgi:hypothetical protein